MYKITWDEWLQTDSITSQLKVITIQLISKTNKDDCYMAKKQNVLFTFWGSLKSMVNHALAFECHLLFSFYD